MTRHRGGDWRLELLVEERAGCRNTVAHIAAAAERLDGVDMCTESTLGVGNGIVKETWWWCFLCSVQVYVDSDR